MGKSRFPKPDQEFNQDLSTGALDFTTSTPNWKEFEIETHKPGKYGRMLVTLFLDEDGVTLNNILVEKGFARYYDGKKREPWFG